MAILLIRRNGRTLRPCELKLTEYTTAGGTDAYQTKSNQINLKQILLLLFITYSGTLSLMGQKNLAA